MRGTKSNSSSFQMAVAANKKKPQNVKLSTRSETRNLNQAENSPSCNTTDKVRNVQTEGNSSNLESSESESINSSSPACHRYSTRQRSKENCDGINISHYKHKDSDIKNQLLQGETYESHSNGTLLEAKDIFETSVKSKKGKPDVYTTNIKTEQANVKSTSRKCSKTKHATLESPEKNDLSRLKRSTRNAKPKIGRKAINEEKETHSMADKCLTITKPESIISLLKCKEHSTQSERTAYIPITKRISKYIAEKDKITDECSETPTKSVCNTVENNSDVKSVDASAEKTDTKHHETAENVIEFSDDVKQNIKLPDKTLPIVHTDNLRNTNTNSDEKTIIKKGVHAESVEPAIQDRPIILNIGNIEMKTSPSYGKGTGTTTQKSSRSRNGKSTRQYKSSINPSIKDDKAVTKPLDNLNISCPKDTRRSTNSRKNTPENDFKLEDKQRQENTKRQEDRKSTAASHINKDNTEAAVKSSIVDIKSNSNKTIQKKESISNIRFTDLKRINNSPRSVVYRGTRSKTRAITSQITACYAEKAKTRSPGQAVSNETTESKVKQNFESYILSSSLKSIGIGENIIITNNGKSSNSENASICGPLLETTENLNKTTISDTESLNNSLSHEQNSAAGVQWRNHSISSAGSNETFTNAVPENYYYSADQISTANDVISISTCASNKDTVIKSAGSEKCSGVKMPQVESDNTAVESTTISSTKTKPTVICLNKTSHSRDLSKGLKTIVISSKKLKDLSRNFFNKNSNDDEKTMSGKSSKSDSERQSSSAICIKASQVADTDLIESPTAESPEKQKSPKCEILSRESRVNTKYEAVDEISPWKQMIEKKRCNTTDEVSKTKLHLFSADRENTEMKNQVCKGDAQDRTDKENNYDHDCDKKPTLLILPESSTSKMTFETKSQGKNDDKNIIPKEIISTQHKISSNKEPGSSSISKSTFTSEPLDSTIKGKLTLPLNEEHHQCDCESENFTKFSLMSSGHKEMDSDTTQATEHHTDDNRNTGKEDPAKLSRTGNSQAKPEQTPGDATLSNQNLTSNNASKKLNMALSVPKMRDYGKTTSENHEHPKSEHVLCNQVNNNMKTLSETADEEDYGTTTSQIQSGLAFSEIQTHQHKYSSIKANKSAKLQLESKSPNNTQGSMSFGIEHHQTVGTAKISLTTSSQEQSENTEQSRSTLSQVACDNTCECHRTLSQNLADDTDAASSLVGNSDRNNASLSQVLGDNTDHSRITISQVLDNIDTSDTVVSQVLGDKADQSDTTVLQVITDNPVQGQFNLSHEQCDKKDRNQTTLSQVLIESTDEIEMILSQGPTDNTDHIDITLSQIDNTGQSHTSLSQEPGDREKNETALSKLLVDNTDKTDTLSQKLTPNTARIHDTLSDELPDKTEQSHNVLSQTLTDNTDKKATALSLARPDNIDKSIITLSQVLPDTNDTTAEKSDTTLSHLLTGNIDKSNRTLRQVLPDTNETTTDNSDITLSQVLTEKTDKSDTTLSQVLLDNIDIRRTLTQVLPNTNDKTTDNSEKTLSQILIDKTDKRATTLSQVLTGITSQTDPCDGGNSQSNANIDNLSSEAEPLTNASHTCRNAVIIDPKQSTLLKVGKQPTQLDNIVCKSTAISGKNEDNRALSAVLADHDYVGVAGKYGLPNTCNMILPDALVIQNGLQRTLNMADFKPVSPIRPNHIEWDLKEEINPQSKIYDDVDVEYVGKEGEIRHALYSNSSPIDLIQNEILQANKRRISRFRVKSAMDKIRNYKVGNRTLDCKPNESSLVFPNLGEIRNINHPEELNESQNENSVANNTTASPLITRTSSSESFNNGTTDMTGSYEIDDYFSSVLSSLAEPHYGQSTDSESERLLFERRLAITYDVMLNRWMEYLSMSAEKMHKLEIKNAIENNYTPPAQTMIQDRDRYIWQVIDDL